MHWKTAGGVILARSFAKCSLISGATRADVTTTMRGKIQPGWNIADLAIKWMLNNMRGGWTVAIIIGNQCTKDPVKVTYRYYVLEWFKVVAAWGERESGSRRVRYKFRYVKLHKSTDGWWASRTTVEPDNPEQLI
ncbi:hypothetical protein RUND412_010206 [Rhizina undulata]